MAPSYPFRSLPNPRVIPNPFSPQRLCLNLPKNSSQPFASLVPFAPLGETLPVYPQPFRFNHSCQFVSIRGSSQASFRAIPVKTGFRLPPLETGRDTGATSLKLACARGLAPLQT
jgi:hypothetical protein